MRSSFLLLPLALAVAIAACAGPQGLNYSPNPQEVATAMGQYLDFGDIYIPKEFKLVREDSHVYQSGELKVGVLGFKSGLEVARVVDFFVANMPRDNWELQSNFAFKRHILLFHKGNRNCLIVVENNILGGLKIEVWVSPHVGRPEELPGGSNLIDKR